MPSRKYVYNSPDFPPSSIIIHNKHSSLLIKYNTTQLHIKTFIFTIISELSSPSYLYIIYFPLILLQFRIIYTIKQEIFYHTQIDIIILLCQLSLIFINLYNQLYSHISNKLSNTNFYFILTSFQLHNNYL